MYFDAKLFKYNGKFIAIARSLWSDPSLVVCEMSLALHKFIQVTWVKTLSQSFTFQVNLIKLHSKKPIF